MSYAPIVLFVYNRPWHTRQTVEALQKNYLAKQSDLIIFSDAPKTAEAKQSVDEVRDYLKNITGFRSIKIVERHENFGLAKSIITGVTDIVNQYGKVIVLEDDIVTSPYFLNFMNDSLDMYQNDEKVMHISGYNYPIEKTNVPETFFIRPATCWSWATWDRAWKYYKKDSEFYIQIFNQPMIKNFNLNGAYPYFQQIVLNNTGNLNTWAIFWYATIFLKDGLSLHPRDSFAQNIGHDNSGENCGEGGLFNVELVNSYNTQKCIQVEESIVGRQAFEKYFFSIKSTVPTRIINKFKKIWSNYV